MLFSLNSRAKDVFELLKTKIFNKIKLFQKVNIFIARFKSERRIPTIEN